MITKANLIILFGKGGLSDVGRHALLAALERPCDEIASIKVLTKYPELLYEKNYNCGCIEEHGNFTVDEKKRFNVYKINSWDDHDEINKHFVNEDNDTTTTTTTTAIISALGNRQPFYGHNDAEQGNKAVIKAAIANNIQRIVAMSSIGIRDDWPPLELHWSGNIMKFLFRTACRKAYRDLTNMEIAYENTSKDDIDYLLVRPVGVGEEAIPENKWLLQEKKYIDVVGYNIAKMDVARYMIQEAIVEPTKHRRAVVIGATSGPPLDDTKTLDGKPK